MKRNAMGGYLRINKSVAIVVALIIGFALAIVLYLVVPNYLFSRPTTEAENLGFGYNYEVAEAVRGGVLQDVITAINNARTPEERKQNIMTAVRFAVDLNKLDIVEHLFQKNIFSDTNALLGFAALFHRFEIMKYAVQHGADVDTSWPKGVTPLAIATTGKCPPEMAAFLINHGANVNYRDDRGFTPLLNTILSDGDREVIKLLLNAGADVNAANYEGRNALMIGISMIDLETAGILIENGINVNKQDVEGTTALIIIATGGKTCAGSVDLAKFLLDNGANAQLKNNRGETALDIARRENFTELISILNRRQE